MNVSELVAAYRSDPDSPFHKLRFRTRANYANLCDRISRDHGKTTLSEINARVLLRAHETWTASGRVAMAHSLVTMLRILVGFGATILEDTDCERICGALHRMRFTAPKARTARLTAEHVEAIITDAHRIGAHSVALAQALQFEGTMRQRDVIGEWVPIGEPGTSDVTHAGDKWVRGVRWSQIDDSLILRHITSKRQKTIEVDLRLGPLVVREFARIGGLPRSGPIIVSEATGRPYQSHEFRRLWRRIATAAGVPAEIYNMDSRAGAITEAIESGASLEHVRHSAAHSNVSMTQRYDRAQARATANVMQLRSYHRNRRAS